MANTLFGFRAEDVERLRSLLASFEAGQLGTQPGSQAHRKLPSPVPFRLAKADSTISAGGSGQVTIWEVDSAGTEVATTEKVTAYDWFQTGANPDDRVYLWRHWQSNARWYFLKEPECYAFDTYNSTAQTLSTSLTNVLFDSTRESDGGIFSLVTSGSSEGNLTINASGLFMMTLTISAFWQTSNPTATNRFTAFMERNTGAGFTDADQAVSIRGTLREKQDGTAIETRSRSAIINVNGGDAFRIRAQQLLASPPIGLEAPAPGANWEGCNWTWHAVCADKVVVGSTGGVSFTSAASIPLFPLDDVVL